MAIFCGSAVALVLLVEIFWLAYEIRRAPLLDENGNVIEEKKP